MLPNILQGPSLLLDKSFLILGNAARCTLIKTPQNASEDDICVLFFHVVLSKVRIIRELYAYALYAYLKIYCWQNVYIKNIILIRKEQSVYIPNLIILV